MRKGTEYAKKLKQAYGKFRQTASRPIPERGDPVEQLIVAVLSQETTTARAEKALKQINEALVDFNELRVSTPAEIADCISQQIPRPVQRAKALLQVLNAVYAREYAVSLESIQSKGIREMKSYLEGLDGITPYAVASTLLWSLGGHAIPINDMMLECLVREGLVDPNATVEEVQAFLERHVSAADAKTFCLDLEAHAAATAPRDGKQKPAKASKPRTKSKKKPAAARKSTTKASARRSRVARKK